MTTADTPNAGAATSASWRFVRNAVDIAVLAALIFAASIALETYAPREVPLAQLVPLLGQPLVSLFFIWVLLRLQGHYFRDIGLGRVNSARDTVLLALTMAVLLFAIALFTEAMGYQRDFGTVRARLEGQPLNLFFFVIYAFVGAGLYEEATFRGFVLDRFARMFGSSRLAYGLAAILQGALFGLAHAHQGQYAIFYTGVLGAVFGFFFLLNGRNLWTLVLGHALYDASRFIFFYVMWTYYPQGLPS